MSTILLILAAWVTVPTVVLVVGAWLLEHAHAEQGPPPTLRPDVQAACEDAWAAEIEAHMGEACALVEPDEPTPTFEALCFERWERQIGSAS